MDDKSEKKRPIKEFAGALAVAFFNEFNRAHHESSITHRVLVALLTALPLAVIAHLTRGKKNQIHWKYVGLFGMSFALAMLIAWRRVGYHARFFQLFSDSFTIAVWIAAIAILLTYMWRQAEGQTE
jgi:di/tricarboxylate transporter